MSTKTHNVVFRTNTSAKHVLWHFSIFFIPFKAAVYPSLEEKKAVAGCGPHIPLPSLLLSFDQLRYCKNHRPAVKKRSSAGTLVALYLLGPSRSQVPQNPCVCVLVEAEREEFLSGFSDNIVSESSHRGCVRTETHARQLCQLPQGKPLFW